jgi:hypothetical protein
MASTLREASHALPCIQSPSPPAYESPVVSTSSSYLRSILTSGMACTACTVRACVRVRACVHARVCTLARACADRWDDAETFLCCGRSNIGSDPVLIRAPGCKFGTLFFVDLAPGMVHMCVRVMATPVGPHMTRDDYLLWRRSQRPQTARASTSSTAASRAPTAPLEGKDTVRSQRSFQQQAKRFREWCRS